MAVSNTSIVNSSLGRIGAKRINDISDTTDTKPEAVQARLHFELTRDSLLRSHFWRFASDRADLSASDVTPDFEWDYQYILPNDFLRMKSIYEGRVSDSNLYSCALEGTMLLSNETTMQIKYIKKVTDPAKFDPLFIEVLILQLALKFVSSLAGGDTKLRIEIQKELKELMSTVRTLDSQETNTIGQYDMETWRDARYR